MESSVEAEGGLSRKRGSRAAGAGLTKRAVVLPCGSSESLNQSRDDRADR
jgi:hypothetical protein